ncbi:unnamed protein product [Brassica oleracea]|uniref:Sucrose-phosphatase n=1 Tax=Brassica napus TaxID=3708 RepID=A0A816Q258_BRANA|nr:unnamed protein product [Brassica napus]
MERLTSPPRLMIVSDLDDTMVEHRNDNENHSLLRFNSLWEEAYRHDSLLVFSTGRAKTMYKKLRKARPLLTPDVIVTSVGTEISYGKSMVPDENWVEIMNNKWNRGIVEEETRKFPELTLQAETEQMPHKLSFHVDKSKVKEVTKELYQRLEKRGLEIKIIFSGGIALDVLPKGGGKGQALSLSANLNVSKRLIMMLSFRILLASLFIHLVLKNHSEALLTSFGSTMGTKKTRSSGFG